MQEKSIKKQRYVFNQISVPANIIFNIIFMAIVLICVVPIILVIMISLTDENVIVKNGYILFPQKLSGAAYQYIMGSGSQIFNAYSISIFVTIVGTIIGLAVMSMYAYPLTRSNFKHKTFFSFFAFFTLIFGGGLVPWVMIYSQLLKIDATIWILIIPYLLNAWWVIILRTFMKTSIPEAIIESGKIDGAGEFRTFLVLVIPLCKAGLATIGLFCMLNYWNDYYLPLIFVKDSTLYNIQYLMYQTLSSIQFLTQSSSAASQAGAAGTLPSEGARMAIAVLSIGPVIFAYPFFQQYFIKGLTIGAVKG
jgi:putative aldouronate transport system permease protein